MDLGDHPGYAATTTYKDALAIRRSGPVIDLDPSEGPLGLLVDDLAEAFGVTAAFMSVRLAKGGFIRRSFETKSAI
jgi:hypothetical protein